MGTVLSRVASAGFISKSVDVITSNVSRETAVGILLTVPFVVKGVAVILDKYRGSRDLKGGRRQFKPDSHDSVQDEDSTKNEADSLQIESSSEASITERTKGDESEDSGFSIETALDNSLESMSSGILSDIMRQSLLKQVLQSDHAEKVTIGETLHSLGEMLVRQGKYEQATKTLERAQEVRKIIIGETMASLGAAMTKKGSLLRDQGEEQLSKAYVDAAEEMKENPGPVSLQRAFGLHREQASGKVGEPLKSVTERIDRRLQRASAEAKSLSQTLTLLAQCNDYGAVDFY